MATKTKKSKKQISPIAEFAQDILANSMDTNNILASGNVKFAFRSHYVNTANNVNGIEQLIKSILTDNGSIFVSEIEKSSMRKIAIAGSMFTEDIISIVRENFGVDRYPDATIKMYLSKFAKGIAKFQLQNNEDSGRDCCRPRCKYYLVNNPK